MKKIAIIIVILILTISSIMISNQPERAEISEACIQENCFQIQTAETPQERATGLQNQLIKENEGMLFIFPEPGIYSFWMKDTLQDLDIIWINEDLEITKILTAQSCQDNCEIYTNEDDAKYVLEITGNLTKQLNITLGDKITIKQN